MSINLSKGTTATRQLSVIANEIMKDFKLKPNYRQYYAYALPWLQAMQCINYLTDMYGAESGIMVVNYFLSNATTWKGEIARNIKKELNTMVKSK
jgi:hypothetical protein